MLRYLAAYGAAAVTLLVLDLVWLGIIARDFYQTQLAAYLRQPPSIPVSVLFYALIVLGVVIFAIAPALREGSWRSALVMGSLFGFFSYMTYDLTNLATVKDWPAALAVTDIVWGTVLSGAAATIGYFAGAAVR